ncbi:MAG TPA: hypothetical protein VHK70_06800 [Burkholderiaceae bacterium]|nr:hypothetical protein [Burkholderiaceae bacterium]
MKRLLFPLVLAAIVAGCGGRVWVAFNFHGTLSGADCFDNGARIVLVHYSIAIDDFSPGSAVTLIDDAGIRWIGSMTTASSFTVEDTSATFRPRPFITASNVSPTGAHIELTSACISFGCCPVLIGDLHV